jgi:hypothetical protein
VLRGQFMSVRAKRRTWSTVGSAWWPTWANKVLAAWVMRSRTSAVIGASCTTVAVFMGVLSSHT